MAKGKKVSTTSIDFDIGIGGIIPATQEAFTGNSFSETIRKDEKTNLKKFKETLREKIATDIKDLDIFPSDKEIFIFIVQYFVSEKDYAKRDIDNMAKTILDCIKELIYKDDGQVKTLLIEKKVEKRISQNFAYIAVKVLGKDQDVDALKISGLERSIKIFSVLITLVAMRVNKSLTCK